MSGTADPGWADSLPDAAPRPSMQLPRGMQAAAPSQGGQEPLTVTVKPDGAAQAAATSWADSLPDAAPTKGMAAQQGTNGSWWDVLKGAGQAAAHSVVGMGNDLTAYMPGPMIARALTGKPLATQVPNPDLPPAASSGEAVGRVIGNAAPGVLMGGGLGGVRGALTALVPSLGASAGGDIGERVGGPAGGLAGSLLGGGAAGLAESGLEGGVNAVTSRLSKQAYGDGPEAVTASDAIAGKAAGKLAKAAEGAPGGAPGVQAAVAGAPDQAATDILGGLKPDNANPAAIAQALRDQFESIDNVGAKLEAGPRANVMAKTQALGTPPLPQDVGANAQAALEAVRAPEKARLDALYSAIDPQGELALGVEQGKLAARQQMTGEGAYFKPTLTGDENSLFGKIDQLPDVIPLKDYRTVMSEIGDQQRAIRSTYGTESLPFRRLSMVKSALYDDMQAALEQQIEDETHGPVSGNVPPENTIVGRLEAASPSAQTEPVTGAQPGGSGGGLRSPIPATPPNGGTGEGGAVNAGEAGSGGLGSDSQVANEAPAQLAPNMPPDQAAALQNANQQYAQYKQTFRTGPVGKMLAPNTTGTQAAQALMQPEKLQAYLAATKGSPDAVRAVQDALVNDLRANSIIGPDGTINAAKFPAWQARRQPVLQQLPDPVRQQFADLGPAQEAYNSTVAQHQQAVDAYQKSVAGRFLNLDSNDPNAVPAALDRILKTADPNGRNALMGDLYNKVAADPAALDGIKSSVIDWTINNVLGASDPRKATAAFIEQNKPWLRRLYGGQGMQNFQQAAAAVNWRQTAQDLSKRLAVKGGGPAGEGHGGNMRTVAFAWIGEHLGEMMQEHHGGTIGFLGGAVAPFLINRLKQRGIQTESDLLKLAMENPAVMRELMQRVPPEGPGPVAARRIAATIQATLAAEAGQPSQQPN